MINQEEFAICRRRGHVTKGSLESGWVPCTACGAWVREKRVTEEREDEPPEEELSSGVRADREIAALNRRIKEKSSRYDDPQQ